MGEIRRSVPVFVLLFHLCWTQAITWRLTTSSCYFTFLVLLDRVHEHFGPFIGFLRTHGVFFCLVSVFV